MNNILFSFPSLPTKLISIFFFIILSNNKILSLFFAPLAYPISSPYYSYFKKSWNATNIHSQLIANEDC